jgi:PTH1 family peptidyl-tRNA hydrolase
MKLLVGLGNPGPSYARQRHNVGFLALDAIAAGERLAGWRKKFGGEVTDGTIAGSRVVLHKPMTFMNRSGHAVAQAAAFFKLAPDDVIVFHDELDLAAGKVRIKTGGGVAGHNGLRSLAACLGGPGFRRVRIGIGHPGDKDRVTGHVLGDFTVADREWLGPLLEALVAAVPLIVAGDDSGAMNKIALLTRPPEPARPRPPDRAREGVEADAAGDRARAGTGTR